MITGVLLGISELSAHIPNVSYLLKNCKFADKYILYVIINNNYKYNTKYYVSIDLKVN